MEIRDLDLKQFIESETGMRFNKANKINSPFNAADKTPSFSIYFDRNNNKWKFKDFSNGEQGDILDFCMKYKGLNPRDARKYLGLTVESTDEENQIKKITGYINWQIEHQDHMKGRSIKGIFPFTDANNNIVYFKVKFDCENGKKQIGYYHIKEDKVINKRGTEEEMIYNYHNMLEAIQNQKILVICEGESDANTLNSILPKSKYCAISVKGCKKLEQIQGFNLRIYILGDTGPAGEKYKNFVKQELINKASSLKIIRLPYIDLLGDNADVSDYLEAGYTREDILRAFDRSLDIKDRYEIQQDRAGIYKYHFKETKDGEIKTRINIADFNIVEAKRMIFTDTSEEGIYLKLKSYTGEIIERTGVATVFDDTKSFRNFLGTMDLSFFGKSEEATQLKQWINVYWAIENEEVYEGAKFINKDGKLILVGNDGAISENGAEYGLKAKNTSLSISDNNEISREELQNLCSRLFKFASKDKTIPIIGTLINNLAIYQNIEAKGHLHHLLIVGESGSGKSAILENIIIPILNLTKDDKKAVASTSPAAIIKGLSEGNYPIVFDEFKPSYMDKYKLQKISDLLRNLYDRATIEKGNKVFSNKVFKLQRPWIMAGEESYPNAEKANIERSCIVYLSKHERTEQNTLAFEWLLENEDILRKFGYSLIKFILSLSTEVYKDIRSMESNYFTSFTDRPKNTAVNIATGIEIFNMLLERYKLPILKNYEPFILQNINSEVLENGAETRSTVEQMIILYNQMIEDGRANNYKSVVVINNGKLYIKTTEMINQIFNFINYTGSADVIPIKAKDFKKQASKAGYIQCKDGKIVSQTLRVIDGSGDSKVIRFDAYDIDLINKLDVPYITATNYSVIDKGAKEVFA